MQESSSRKQWYALQLKTHFEKAVAGTNKYVEKKGVVMNERQFHEKGIDVVMETSCSTEVNAARETDGDDGFQLTVRKLEMPVRPRGVLAE